MCSLPVAGRGGLAVVRVDYSVVVIVAMMHISDRDSVYGYSGEHCNGM